MENTDAGQSTLGKKFAVRILLGAVIGISIGYTVLTVLAVAMGFTSLLNPISPFADNPTVAILEQYFASAVLGAVFGAASVIWDIEKWGLPRQTVVYFLITLPIMLCIAALSGWVSLDARAIAIFIGIFIAIFLVIWLVYWVIARNNARDLNQKINHPSKD